MSLRGASRARTTATRPRRANRASLTSSTKSKGLFNSGVVRQLPEMAWDAQTFSSSRTPCEQRISRAECLNSSYVSGSGYGWGCLWVTTASVCVDVMEYGKTDAPSSTPSTMPSAMPSAMPSSSPSEYDLEARATHAYLASNNPYQHVEDQSSSGSLRVGAIAGGALVALAVFVTSMYVLRRSGRRFDCGKSKGATCTVDSNSMTSVVIASRHRGEITHADKDSQGGDEGDIKVATDGGFECEGAVDRVSTMVDIYLADNPHAGKESQGDKEVASVAATSRRREDVSRVDEDSQGDEEGGIKEGTDGGFECEVAVDGVSTMVDIYLADSP
ncbi:hypothetical protein ACHAWF_009417 [Thalassiosira exigua]